MTPADPPARRPAQAHKQELAAQSQGDKDILYDVLPAHVVEALKARLEAAGAGPAWQAGRAAPQRNERSLPAACRRLGRRWSRRASRK